MTNRTTQQPAQAGFFVLARELVNHFEGCRLHAYADAVGVCTIGWGCTGGDIRPDTVWTQERADRERDQRINTLALLVRNRFATRLTDGQTAACIDFAYNLGIGSFRASTLAKRIDDGDFEGAADQFRRWVYAGGRKLPGLVRRRAAERLVFLGNPWSAQ